MRVIPALIAAAFAPSGLGFCTQPDQAVANVLVARACEAAQTAYERVATRVFRDFPNLNLPYLWSYRLLQSELQKYDKPAKTLQALKAHLERMHFLNRIASRLAAGGKIGQGYESVEVLPGTSRVSGRARRPPATPSGWRQAYPSVPTSLRGSVETGDGLCRAKWDYRAIS